MEEFTVDEVRQLQRQAKRKKAQGMNKAERIVEAYLRATRPHALQIAYEGMTVYLGGITYTPDFVVVMPGHNREYVINAARNEGKRVRRCDTPTAVIWTHTN